MSLLFSIIIPTYNRAHMISRGIESVIDQTHPHWELIIIDDGSSDNTKDVVGSYKDPRIRYFWQENQERSVARNNGIDKARGEWICFLDSDDWYKKDTLEFYRGVIEQNPRIDIIKSDFTVVDENGKKLYDTIPYGGGDLGQQKYVMENYGTLMNYCFSEKSIADTRFEDIPPAEDKCFVVEVLNKFTFYETSKSIAYQLDHIGRSINRPLEVNKAKNVVNVMSRVLGDAKYISRYTAFKAVLNWQRNMLYAHWHYHKSIVQYLRYLFAFAPLNIFLWADSIRIIFFSKSS